MTNAIEKRLNIVNLIKVASEREQPGLDVVEGLTVKPAKYLPSKYFYDERGSQLFEQICDTPEYYLTRTETGILQASGGVIAQLTGPCDIVELGSGSSTKTRLLLNAYQAAGHPLHYLPVDVSDTMLIDTAHKLLDEYSALSISAIASTYEPALKALPPKQLPTRMIAFIGSTIGNLQPKECDEFLSRISKTLAPGDFFLLGLDLQKESSILEAAYNDAQGINAQFNLNMLRHLNRKLEGNFDLSNFEHVALYNKHASQIEMYLKSLATQTVQLKALDLTVQFSPGEYLQTEISRKFSLLNITQVLAHHQLDVTSTFTDKKQWFGLLLCQRRR